MEVKQALSHLEKNSLFKSWRKKNTKNFFSYAFKLLMEEKDDDWQIGFYSKSKDTITTFVIESGKVRIREDEQVFKKEDSSVAAIELDKAKMDFKTIMESAENYEHKNYPKERNLKVIAILQNIPKYGTIWNITFVTETFNTLNIKLEASTGKVLESKLESILSLGKQN